MESTRNILIVDDDPVFLQTTSILFKRAGFEVVKASDGQGAMQLLKSTTPDAVLLDIFMPNVNGVEVLRFIRNDSRLIDVPVVVISSSSTTRHLDSAWRLGANKCIAKDHFTPQDLVRVIEEVIQAARTKPKSAEAVSSASLSVEQHRDELLNGLADLGKTIRERWQAFVNSESDQTRLAKLGDVEELMQKVAESSKLAELWRLALLTANILALIHELARKPQSVNASSIRTLGQGVDLVVVLFNAPITAMADRPPASNVFVVDHAVNSLDLMAPLRKGEFTVTSLDDPHAAMLVLEQNRFHCVFWDIRMPGLDGLEMCGRLRNLPIHTKTPVVLFTDLQDFETRDRSTLAGATDLMAKPFRFEELNVKALTLVLRDQLTAYLQ